MEAFQVADFNADNDNNDMFSFNPPEYLSDRLKWWGACKYVILLDFTFSDFLF